MSEIKPEEIKPGMFIRIFKNIGEGDKTKIQRLEGLVIARKHGKEPGATITLRKIIDGVGVEWIIPIFSPLIQKIELLKTSRVRKSKLYYLRNKSQKETRKKLKLAA